MAYGLERPCEVNDTVNPRNSFPTKKMSSLKCGEACEGAVPKAFPASAIYTNAGGAKCANSRVYIANLPKGCTSDQVVDVVCVVIE